MNRCTLPILLFASEAAVWGDDVTSRNPSVAASAVLLGLNNRKGQLLQRWSVEVSIADTVRWKSLFVRPDGAVAAEDELHWGAFVRGDTLRNRFAVPDQLRSFAFRVSRDRSWEGDRGDVIVVRMIPSSVLLRRFVEPIHFRFTPNGALLSIEPRTLPVESRRNSAVPVDALFEVQDRAALAEITQRSLRP